MFDIDKQLPSVFAMGKPIRADAVPIRMSQQAESPALPPVQASAMAAMVGTRQDSSARTPNRSALRSPEHLAAL
jgi:hypothetical protein